MHMLQSLFYLTTAPTCFGHHQHPSSGVQNNCNYTICLCQQPHENKQINKPPTTHSNQFHLLHESSRQQYSMYIIHYPTERIAFSAEIHYQQQL